MTAPLTRSGNWGHLYVATIPDTAYVPEVGEVEYRHAWNSPENTRKRWRGILVEGRKTPDGETKPFGFFSLIQKYRVRKAIEQIEGQHLQFAFVPYL